MKQVRRKWTPENLLEEAKRIHGEIYDYDLTGYVGINSKIQVTCREHGVTFTPKAADHIYKESGCPAHKVDKLVRMRKAGGICASLETFTEAAKAVHGDKYDYSRVILKGAGDQVEVVCNKDPAHGPFFPTPSAHVHAKTTCPKCAFKAKGLARRQSHEDFVADCLLQHGGDYDYSKTKYETSHDMITVTCKKHGDFTQIAYDHKGGHGCTKCQESQAQKDIAAMIEASGVRVIQNYTMKAGKEIDVYCPDLGLGFEYNGLFWHSDGSGKGPSYHLDKTNMAKAEGIHIIHIFEDEWVHRNATCRAWIMDKLGLHSEIHNARNCKVVTLTFREASKFYIAHHLQGAPNPGRLNVGLVLKDTNELVAAMTFGVNQHRNAQSADTSEALPELILSRFCTKGRVRGGFSKLLKHFIRNNAGNYSRIVSFSDVRWSTGVVYEVNGFTKVSTSGPDYYWIKGQRRYVKERFTHARMVNKFTNYSRERSESENCRANGFLKIYDCGKDKWVLESP